MILAVPRTPSDLPTMVAAATLHPISLSVAKQGDARYLGHLDFARAVERSLRRAGLPVQYSAGFNPKIKLAFADALPLGVASEGEWCTFFLTADLAPEDVRVRLAAALPGALTVVAAQRGKAPSPAARERYHLEVLDGARSATDALHSLLACDACLVDDPRTGQLLDVRPLLVSGETMGAGLMVELVANTGRPPRPGPIVRALCDLARKAGSVPPRFGTATRLQPAAPPGDLTWSDAASPLAEPPPPPASSSSTPANPKRAASPS